MSVTSLEISGDNPINKDSLSHVLEKLSSRAKPNETIALDPKDEPSYLTLLQALHDSTEEVLALPDFEPPTNLERFPREVIHFPGREGEEGNEWGAWGWKCTVKDTWPDSDKLGILSGKTFIVKDNVSVAGVEAMLGTDVFSGWVPTSDATVVSRSLLAGATLLGKGTCENMSMSASSFSASTGPVHNPFAKGWDAAGSSSGCGTLVALGQADLAIGGDQGGSVRLPCSWCGLYGMKPTFGLVPYTGIAPLEPSFDHTGPMTRTCRENALFLKAVAGRDAFDVKLNSGAPNIPFPEDVPDYPSLLEQFRSQGGNLPLKGFKVGLLKEGFDVCQRGGMNDPRIAAKCREAAARWKELGAEVKEVSVPMHILGPTLWVCVARMGCIPILLGGSSGVQGFYINELTKKLDESIKSKRGWDSLPWAPKNMILNGMYLWDKHPELYGKATNQIHLLRAKYTEALSDVDILVMPTTPYLPNKHAAKEADVLEKISKSLGQTLNTCPFNVTGHPALSMPVGMLESLEEPSLKFPVGLQVVGKHLDELTVYKAALAWEDKFNWKEL
ncbi:Glutamyl-tRNA amidotransferase subunit A [Dendrothele bispora CBS 962.96]|uniref:Glutamyl-tRNA amidotransferase subunit A n=1 Tax=Dendrothele bispora (strain CBS 962.96) TaxID=1314807 RepID=A0A4S8MBT2_DENBC|nr:Glutamyl-tRNA amidotransferase subunit A [Dendrothele bispora CBS 962.96]